MKRLIVNLLILWSVTIPSVNADSLRLDDYVTLPGGLAGQSKLKAFRVNGSCRNWNYLPSRLIANGTFIHSTDLTTTLVGQRKLLSLVTELEFMASPGTSSADLDALKAEIFSRIQGNKECAGQVSSAEQIALSSALVQTVSKVADVTDAQGTRYFSETRPTFESKSTETYRDPMSPTSVTYMLDATHPGAVKRLRDLQLNSQVEPVLIGQLTYLVQGITAKLNSHLRIKGEMSALFDSAVKQTKCTVQSSSKSLSDTGAIAAVAGGASFKSEETSATCDYNLITEFKGGSLKGMIEMDHNESVLDIDGKPIMYATCNVKGVCHNIPLVDFVEYQLYTMFLTQNFDTIVREMGNNTFEVKLGRKGITKTGFDVDLGYLRTFHGRMGLSVPVYASGLESKHFDFSFVNEPFYACASGRYRNQALIYQSELHDSPVPIAPECITNLSGAGGTL